MTTKMHSTKTQDMTKIHGIAAAMFLRTDVEISTLIETENPKNSIGSYAGWSVNPKVTSD